MFLGGACDVALVVVIVVAAAFVLGRLPPLPLACIFSSSSFLSLRCVVTVLVFAVVAVVRVGLKKRFLKRERVSKKIRKN